MSHNIKCSRIHGEISTFFFDICGNLNIAFFSIIAIQYLSYDITGG